MKDSIPIIERNSFDGIQTVIHLVTGLKYYPEPPFAETRFRVKVCDEPETQDPLVADTISDHIYNTSW